MLIKCLRRRDATQALYNIWQSVEYASACIYDEWSSIRKSILGDVPHIHPSRRILALLASTADEEATVSIQTRANPNRESAFLIRTVFQRKAASAVELDGQPD